MWAMRVGSYQFRPRGLVTAATVVVLSIMLAAGLWQKNKAAYKFEQRTLRADNAELATVDLTTVADLGPAWRGRRVRLAGRLDLERQLLLDNQKHQGRPGYHVFTPLELSPGGERILVNRGWLPWGASRTELPPVDGPHGPTRLTGRLAGLPQVGLRWGEPDAGYPDWPKAVTYLDADWLAQQFGQALPDLVLLLEGGDRFGLVRAGQGSAVAQEPMPPEKHLSYAFQWFAMALALLVIYVVVNCKRIKAD